MLCSWIPRIMWISVWLNSEILAVLNKICCTLRRKGVHKFTVCAYIHETCDGPMCAHCWSEQEPHAPFLSGGDVRSWSKPCCIFNEGLTCSEPLSHCLSCLCLLHPHLHGILKEKRILSITGFHEYECHPTPPVEPPVEVNTANTVAPSIGANAW